MTDHEIRLIGIGFVLGVGVMLFLMGVAWYFAPWMRAMLVRVRLSPADIIGMRLRRTPVNLIVDALMSLRMRGYAIRSGTPKDLEAVFLEDRGRYTDGRDLADALLDRSGEEPR